MALLRSQLRAARDRQAASAEILRVISQSLTDTQPVFEAIVLTAVRLLRCDMSFVMLCDPPAFWVAAAATPEGLFDELTLKKEPIDPSANFPSRTIVEKRAIYLPDWSLIELPEHERRVHETVGVNSALYLPLMREGECIGLLTLGGKQANIFGESEIALAESFRDQALIAIENARLFSETQEALERQTATAEILKVIASSPSDVQPVFDAIAASANRLIGGFSTTVCRFNDDSLHLVAFTPTHPAADEALKASFPLPVARFPPFESLRDGEVVEFADTEAESGVPPVNRDIARLRGYRSMVFTPLMSNGASIGVISVTRKEPGKFAAHHVQLLQTFADQAVIAIENARLFNETREALERQTATADVLKVISRSTFDLPPVLDTLISSACRLCEADLGTVRYQDGSTYRVAADYGSTPGWRDHHARQSAEPDRGSIFGRTVVDGRTIHIPDVLADPEYTRLATQKLMGFRAALGVPLIREGRVFGVLNL